MEPIIVKVLTPVVFVTAALTSVARAADPAASLPAEPLPSWNESGAKKAVVDFVAKVTTHGSPDFVPVAERIAVFDNDGTLWAEQPLPFQAFFMLDRVKALAPQHPEWQTQEPFASLLKGDMKAALAGGEHAVVATHDGDSRRHDLRRVRRRSSRPGSAPRSIRRRGGSSPRWSTSRCSSCSPTCGRTASRRSSCPAAGSSSCARGRRRVYGIPPEQVVGSSVKMKFELRDGKPVLVRLPEINFVDDGPGKPVGIQMQIGRRPIAAFGNSDGDLQMLQWTAAGAGPRLCLYVHHTDAEREWAYDRRPASAASTRASTRRERKAGPSST